MRFTIYIGAAGLPLKFTHCAPLLARMENLYIICRYLPEILRLSVDIPQYAIPWSNGVKLQSQLLVPKSKSSSQNHRPWFCIKHWVIWVRYSKLKTGDELNSFQEYPLFTWCRLSSKFNLFVFIFVWWKIFDNKSSSRKFVLYTHATFHTFLMVRPELCFSWLSWPEFSCDNLA